MSKGEPLKALINTEMERVNSHQSDVSSFDVICHLCHHKFTLYSSCRVRAAVTRQNSSLQSS